MIESDLSTTLAETTTTVRSAVVTQRQAPKIHRRRKLCRMAHSTIVDVQLCLRDSVLQKFPEYAGIVKVIQVQFVDGIVKVQNMMVRTSSQ